MKALVVDNSNGTPTMVMGTHEKPTPGSRELLVKIEATALNRADLLQKSGNYPVPEGASTILDLELAGIVEKFRDNTIDFFVSNYIMKNPSIY